VVVERVELRSFRNLERIGVSLAAGMTLIHGPNGSGKTALLEGLCFGLTGHSPRTRREREVIHFEHPVARAEVTVVEQGEVHVWSSAVERAGTRQRQLDGARLDRTSRPVATAPRLTVFLPDSLELVKGAPGVRRDHVDGLVSELWPARADCRRRYGGALGQRNALLTRIRSGAASQESLGAWDEEVARLGVALMESRRDALAAVQDRLRLAGGELGLPAPLTLAYKPRSRAATAAELAAELAAHRETDLARGFSGHGPHRDDLELMVGGRSVRRYGSQGQQRAALLALLLAEREATAGTPGRLPVLLLDDVLSELDATRRGLLFERLSASGQVVMTATEREMGPEDIEAVAMACPTVAAVR
jgi:DNA replication and repair protein RecF